MGTGVVAPAASTAAATLGVDVAEGQEGAVHFTLGSMIMREERWLR